MKFGPGIKIDEDTTRFRGPYRKKMGRSYYIEKRTWGDLDKAFPWVALRGRTFFLSRHRTRAGAVSAIEWDDWMENSRLPK